MTTISFQAEAAGEENIKNEQYILEIIHSSPSFN